MKATTTRVKWDKEDVRLLEHALKVVLSNIEAVALDKDDYEAAFNQAIDHVIDQLDLYRE